MKVESFISKVEYIAGGARGHKKEVAPVGSKLYRIKHQGQCFRYAYTNLAQAEEACANLSEKQLTAMEMAGNFRVDYPVILARTRTV